MINRPNLSPTAFWDVDMTTLDYEVNAGFVIEKVMNYGLWVDILEILRYYGHERVMVEALQAGYLKKKTLSFCCTVFNLTPDQFLCFTRQQFNPLLWNH